MSSRSASERQKLTGLYACALGLMVAVVVLDGLSKAIAGRSRTRSKPPRRKFTRGEVSIANLVLGLLLATVTTLVVLPQSREGIEWTPDRVWAVAGLVGLYVIGQIVVVIVQRSGILKAFFESVVPALAGFGLAILGDDPLGGFLLVAIAVVILVAGGYGFLAREKRNAPRPSSPFEGTGDH